MQHRYRITLLDTRERYLYRRVRLAHLLLMPAIAILIGFRLNFHESLDVIYSVVLLVAWVTFSTLIEVRDKLLRRIVGVEKMVEQSVAEFVTGGPTDSCTEDEDRPAPQTCN
jgi:hypothetical protein